MKRNVQSAQRLTRVVNFKVTGTGTAAINTGATERTLVDNGTGDYTITFAKSGTRAVNAIATSGTAALYCAVTALSSTAVTVKSYDAAGSATDAIFYLQVTLADAGES